MCAGGGWWLLPFALCAALAGAGCYVGWLLPRWLLCVPEGTRLPSPPTHVLAPGARRAPQRGHCSRLLPPVQQLLVPLHFGVAAGSV